MKKVSKVVMTIMGTLIGAGFASGREIDLFFNQFGYLGLVGIMISSILTALIIFVVLQQIEENNISQYAGLLNHMNQHNTQINKCLNVIVNSFLLISFFIMIAGFSAYMKQAYQIPTYLSNILFVAFCYIVFRKNLQGMMKVNSYLVPFLLAFVIYLGIINLPYLLESKMVMEIEPQKRGFIFSSLLYASYNSIILIPVLVTMKSYCKTKVERIKTSIICAITLIFLSFCIYGLLLRGQFFTPNIEMPLLQITLEFGKIFQWIYGLVIIGSIFTSAIATGYTFLQNVSKSKKMYHTILILISIIGILVSNVGFSNLIQVLYPLFGLLGLLQISMLFKQQVKNKL